MISKRRSVSRRPGPGMDTLSFAWLAAWSLFKAAFAFATCSICNRSNEFTDAEIAAAFKFLDLDGNQHIGAAEIRHILICMGELITDEEVHCFAK